LGAVELSACHNYRYRGWNIEDNKKCKKDLTSKEREENTVILFCIFGEPNPEFPISAWEVLNWIFILGVQN
jgi:hypothetical protein